MKTVFILVVICLVLTAVFGGVRRSACPPGKALTNCDIDPCEREKHLGCPLNRQAHCVSDYCDGCYDTWWLNGKQVWCWADK